jgi:hypothetical protein
MKILIIILLALFSLSACSQSEKVLIKFCPLTILDLNEPTIQGGIELKVSNKITWYNEFGIKIGHSLSDSYTDTAFVKSNGFKVKSEIRYYYKNKDKFTFDGNYFAANIFFIHDLHNRAITYSQSQSTDTSTRTDDFGVKKNVYGINFVYGQQTAISKRFYIDVYGGLGLRLRNISTINEEYNKNTDIIQDPIDPKIWEIGETADANAGFSILPNFTLGFRLCYRL